MSFTGRNWRRGALVVAGLAVAAIAAPGALPASAAKVPGPVLKLEVAQGSIRVGSFHGRVGFDPGIWLEALGSPLEFDVQRASYTKPVTLTQIIRTPNGGVIRRPLPASLLEGWFGLRNFATLTIRNTATGKVVSTTPVVFCPNTFDPARVSPGGPPTDPYPQQCGSNPFTTALVWGVQRGWASEPDQFFNGKLPVGAYTVTETISPVYTRLLHIAASAASGSLRVTVFKAKGCCGPPPARAAQPGHRPPAVPALANPPRSALPDLVALPAWSIGVSHPKKGARDLLDFAATVWIGGNAQLDVEGFRTPGSPIMKAYQYFWRNGKVIGRARAGTMGFSGYNHWHFQQFARYALVNSAKSQVVASHKEGFCIAPVDAINLLLPHAVWNPGFTGLGGQCGSPQALWATEELPLGWGDTYEQTVPGQAIDITSVPNGTYYIEVVANPEKLLHETTTSNDISYRKIILGGTPGHRTVKVPPWHGIDPES
jgi:hypothetical protein